MVDLIPQLSPGELVPLLAIAGLFGSLVIITLTYQIRKYACHRQETSLKRELVERGLSVDEIERVVAACKTVA